MAARKRVLAVLMLVLAVSTCALAVPGNGKGGGKGGGEGNGKGGNGKGSGKGGGGGGGILGQLTGGNMTGGWGQGGILSGLSSLLGNGSAPGDLGGIFGRKGGNGKGKGGGNSQGSGKGNGKGKGKGKGKGEGNGQGSRQGNSTGSASVAAVATTYSLSDAKIGTMGVGNGKGQGNGNGKGKGQGKGKGKGFGWGKKGKSAGGVLAKLRGSSVVDDALTAIGDANATGVLAIILIHNGTDYDVAFTARISLSHSDAPTSLTLNSGTTATNGPPLLDFATATTADGTSPPAWTTAPSAPAGAGGVVGHAWGQVQRAFGRSQRLAGLNTFTMSGVWAAAGTTGAADGVQTVKDVALAVAANPSAFYALLASPGFDAGAARGQFQKAPKGNAFGLRS